jgi:hypothetical protein
VTVSREVYTTYTTRHPSRTNGTSLLPVSTALCPRKQLARSTCTSSTPSHAHLGSSICR